MGKLLISGGSGGVDTSMVTAGAGDVIKDKVIVDANGNPLTGTLELSGNAETSYVLSGYTFYNTDAKTKLTGTMAVQSLLSFSAAPYSSSQITFTWKNPAKGAFSGVIIVGKTGSVPTSISDGTRYYKGYGTGYTANTSSSTTISGFAEKTTYYFRAFSYATKDNAEWIGDSLTANATTPAKPKGTQTFTSSGTFTVPAGVTSIDIFVLGGGAAGGGSSDLEGEYPAAAGGGGGGYTNTIKSYSVTPGQTFSVTIGAGGAAASPGWGTGGTGGTTSFGSVISAGGGYGGEGGSQDQQRKGGSGGSGGGGSTHATGYAGGSDGGNGNGNTGYHAGGSGQGRTTRAFAESSNTLYAGGGGGGPGRWSGTRAAGGAGGGGMGGNLNVGPGSGSANTGGGGGGGGSSGSWCYGGNGGSGICIVRWGY